MPPEKIAYKPISGYEEKFIPPKKIDFINWLVTNGVFISEIKYADNATETIYSVPDEKTFFVISATLQYLRIVAGAGIDSVHLEVGNQKILISDVLKTVDTHFTVSISLSIPIKAGANTLFKVTSEVANLGAWGCVSGYLVDNKKLRDFHAFL